MKSSTLFRLSGWASILSGICLLLDTLLIEPFLPETIVTSSIGHLTIMLGFFAIVGIYLWQREESGIFGGVAFTTNFLGLGYLSGVMFFKNYIAPYLSLEVRQQLVAGPPKAIFLASALLFEVGVVLFGIVSVKAGKFPRLAAILYTVGYTAFVVEAFVPAGGALAGIIRAFQAMGGFAVIWMGYTLTSSKGHAPSRTGVLQSPSV